MTATDELRKLLDERGVEHDDKAIGTSRFTEWDKDENYNVGAAYVEYADGCVLRIYDCTPEQAIDATLGNGECTNVSGVPLKFTCSECEDSWSIPYDGFNYCPSCGRAVKQ